MLKIFQNKIYDLIVLFVLCIIAFFVFMISNSITQEKIEIIKKEKYNIYSKNIDDEIKLLIKNKKELTLAIALSMSKNDNIIKALTTNNIKLLKLQDFSKTLKDTIQLKNAWFQIIDKKGTTFYRSWISKRGDPIIKSRIDVAKMIEKPQIMSTISTGKFDMTFKSMVPIYDKDEFIGMFEIITHFNSIAIQLMEHNIDSLIFVDKKYKNQLTKALTKTFLSDYYIANSTAKRELIEYIKSDGIEKYIHSDTSYIVDKDNNKFIVIYKIPDIYNNPMGTIVAVKDLDSLNMDDINFVKTNMIFYVVLVILIMILIGYYLVVSKHKRELDKKVIARTLELNNEKNYIQTILDTNPSIIVVTRNSKIINANNRFLEFFHYENLDQFSKDYDCVCDLFVTLDDKKFPKDKKIGGELWSTYLAHQTDKEHFVKLKFKQEIYYFTVNASYLKYDGDILLTFQNITDLKNKDKLLYEQSKMASMGEMIGNIAHQWRQPLSIISTAATGIKVQKKFANLTDQYLEESCDLINSNSQYLSKTIDDFRDFIKGNREKEKFVLNNEIDKLLQLINPSLAMYNIELIVDLEDDLELEGYSNELLQCLINIYNNAKDAVKEKAENERFIFIKTKKLKDKISISIKDSGGGINSDILSKIFDPYFTTKHPSIGTGLGLHMTYNLIVDGMNGSIDVKNKIFKYKGKQYKGASFSIKLPLS